MKLKAVYSSAEDIPQGYEDLYTERNGQFELTGIEGIKTQGDVDRVQESLRKERDEHKATKAQLQKFGELDADEVHEKLDRVAELEAAAGGKIDDDKMEELVQARLKRERGPLEREITQLKTKNQEFEQQVTEFQQKDHQRTIHDHVRKAAQSQKLVDTAVDDALMVAERVMDVTEDGRVVTKDNVGVTPGLDPQVWLTEMQQTRPHWWGPSQGGGARGGSGGGGGGNNPFSAESWNLTEQGRMVRESPERADQMAKSAGTTVGGGKPQPKK